MTEAHTYGRLHQLSGDVLRLDLSERARLLLEAARDSDGGRAAETLVKEGPLRLTLMAFTAGAAMHEHQTGSPVAVQVLQGLVALKLPGDEQELHDGEAVVIRPGIVHSLVALTESTVLLVVTVIQ